MKLFLVLVPLGLFACAAYFVANTRPAPASSNSPNLLDAPRHPVTEPMIENAFAVAGKTAPDFVLLDSKKVSVRLSDEYKDKAVLLVFTKDGCPCSMEAQPFYNALAKGYAGKAEFLGIEDAAAHVADKYRDDFQVPYRMLVAPDETVFRSYDSQRSVYATLIAQGGKIVKQWPGYSRAMLAELNKSLASETGTGPIKLETAMAPEKLSSGCMLFRPVGQ